ncbi:hypothetical protein ACQEVB_18605 [Pseudonocardia sp. CA-107938]|uniref:hypothetical protein n=1 Tax=Pseudonocardia sp. CA-107938 TaxID=3240021 RepID=UPI003D8A5E98
MRSLRSVLVVSAAAAFGVVTWSTAHLLTTVLFAHTHDGTSPCAPVHQGVGAIMLAMAAFVVTVVAAGLAPGQPRWAGLLRPGSLAAAGAPATFLLIEWAEHLAAGAEGPPAALLVVGAGVHAAMGAATPLLWNVFVQRTIVELALPQFAVPPSDEESPAQAPDRAWAASRLSSRISSRAPPAYGNHRPYPCRI